MVYIPFLGDSLACHSSETVKAHVQVKRAIRSKELSGAIPSVIATGGKFTRVGWKEVADDTLPHVKYFMEGKVLKDCILPYAVLLWFTKEVRYSTIPTMQTAGNTLYQTWMLSYVQFQYSAVIHDHASVFRITLEKN